MKILKFIGIVFLLFLLVISISVLQNGGDIEGGVNNIVDIIRPSEDPDPDPGDDPSDEVLGPYSDDLTYKTVSLPYDSNYFQGNEIRGLCWKSYDLSNTQLSHEGEVSKYDGVLTSGKNSVTYHVPVLTNRLTDQVVFPHISYWDINEYVAYDFSLSTTTQFPNGLVFGLLSTGPNDKGVGKLGEKLYIERINGKDILFKSCLYITEEETIIPEEDWEVPGIPEYRIDTVYRYENIEIGSLVPFQEYHFTFLIETNAYTFNPDTLLDQGSLYATYAYVYVNGEFLTSLGFNINENSDTDQGWDVEYALGFMFDTKYKTVNAGSNFTLSNLLTAGTNAAEFYVSGNWISSDDTYIADLFENFYRYVPLKYNPDWYYSDAVIMSDPSSEHPKELPVTYYTQTMGQYSFQVETISAVNNAIYFSDSVKYNSTDIRIDHGGNFNLGNIGYSLYSFVFSVESMPVSTVELFFANSASGTNAAGTSSPHIYLVPVLLNNETRLQLAVQKDGVYRYYGYIELYQNYEFSFVIETDGITHFYVDGCWLFSLENFLMKEHYANATGDSFKCRNFYFLGSSAADIGCFCIGSVHLTKFDGSKIALSDTFIEHVFSNPLSYLYHNPDFYLYNLSKPT